jgi:hypothetical protein
LSFRRSVGLVFLGVVLGIGLTIGTYYGVREYAPDVASHYVGRLLGISSQPGAPDSGTGPGIDSATVRGVVQDILASEQGRAILWDLVQSQSRETFDAFFKEAMRSPEFRQALSDALGTFLSSPEGKALLKRVASDVLTP